MRYFITLCLVSVALPAFAQEDGYFGPITRWGNKPVEPGTTASVDSLQKMAAELAELKNRLKLLEENQTQYSVATKTQFKSMNDSLKSLQTCCDKLQQETVAYKPAITQTGATIPVVKQPADDTKMHEATIKRFDDMAKRMEEMTNQMQEMMKLNLQVQANTRDLNDIKKKYEAQERDLIQAQSDIGKLQQDLARMGTRPGTDTRSSLALPLPPGSTQPATTTNSSIKLVNSYPGSVTVIVDGQFYTLRSNDTLTLNKAPGYFTYEVLGIQGNTLRTLGTAETMTIHIVPR